MALRSVCRDCSFQVDSRTDPSRGTLRHEPWRWRIRQSLVYNPDAPGPQMEARYAAYHPQNDDTD